MLNLADDRLLDTTEYFTTEDSKRTIVAFFRLNPKYGIAIKNAGVDFQREAGRIPNGEFKSIKDWAQAVARCMVKLMMTDSLVDIASKLPRDSRSFYYKTMRDEAVKQTAQILEDKMCVYFGGIEL